jgi:uncharacterized delta-60 repeat protein
MKAGKIPAVAAVLALALAGMARAADGDVDAGFGMGGRQTIAFDIDGEFVDRAHGLVVAPNGMIYLAGYAHDGPDSSGIAIARLLPDGMFDNAYGHVTHAHPAFEWVYVTDAALQPDGKLVVIGYGQTDAGRDGLVCRFLPDGTIDASFGDQSEAGCAVVDASIDDVFQAVAIQADGRIVIAGKTFDAVNRATAVRLDADGQADATFGKGGVNVILPFTQQNTVLHDIATTPDGDLIAIGHSAVGSGNNDWLFVRLRGSDGLPDPDFNGSGVRQIAFDVGAVGARRDYGRAVRVLANGSILAAGHVQQSTGVYCPAMVRLSAGGQFETFGVQGKYVDALCLKGLEVNDLSIQFDYRPVLIASSSSNDFQVWRLDPNGTRDHAFGEAGHVAIEFDLGTIGAMDAAMRVIAHPTGIVVAGYAQTDDGSYDFAVARLCNDLRQRPRPRPQ